MFVVVSRVAQSVQCLCWTTGWSRFDSRQRRKYFSSSLCVQTGSEAHPASCTTGTGGAFPRLKRGRGVTLITHPYLVPRSRMTWTSYVLSHQVPSWRVVEQLYTFAVIPDTDHGIMFGGHTGPWNKPVFNTALTSCYYYHISQEV
jgi:hypothetical protein